MLSGNMQYGQLLEAMLMENVSVIRIHPGNCFLFISKLYLASVFKLHILRVAEPFKGSQTLIPSVD